MKAPESRVLFQKAAAMELSQVDLYDPDSFVEAVPREMFQVLRREAPVFWHQEPGGQMPVRIAASPTPG